MESLNVIALVSGGKDSFFSLLHCLRNGHNVVALGNLYPPAPSPSSSASISRSKAQALAREQRGDGEGGSGSAGGGGEEGKEAESEAEEEEADLNSFMYQTVGHTVIPLYEQALGIPLYRQEIKGGAVHTGTSYSPNDTAAANSNDGDKDKDKDETESLVPLLQKILQEHPEANALSAGAILSTYQRTRIESIALRLGLVPLAYLWQYPSLPPRSPTSLLEDMECVGLEARIVKVASAGLDEGFLWEDVVSRRGRMRVERAMSRFGRVGDGGVIGEGGEFESLVLDGPRALFKGRIVVVDGDRGGRVVREGGGSAWLSIGKAEVVMKGEEEGGDGEGEQCRVPDLLDARFEDVLTYLKGEKSEAVLSSGEQVFTKQQESSSPGAPNPDVLNWSFSSAESSTAPLASITEEASRVISSIRQRLTDSSLNSTHIISAVIILRSMADFAAVNKIYSTLFPHPNPPSRVTISCGSLIPSSSQNLSIHLTLHIPSLLEPQAGPQRKALHVQSRSYWAPANIGPYSQAISFPLSNAQKRNNNDDEGEEEGSDSEQTWIVKVAGQIPLIPASMLLPDPTSTRDGFLFQTVLALQHLWRIGVECDVRWWIGAVAYLPASSTPPSRSTPSDESDAAGGEKAILVGRAWRETHAEKNDEEGDSGEERDLWEEKHKHSYVLQQATQERNLPDWDSIQGQRKAPPVFTVEVEELPRGSGVEWHALAAVAGGVRSIKTWTHSPPQHEDQDQKGTWKIHQTLINGTHKYTIILIDYTPSLAAFKNRLAQALVFHDIGEEALTELGSMTYVDVGIKGLWEEGGNWNAKLPCRGIWDGEGKKVGGVWVLDGLVGSV